MDKTIAEEVLQSLLMAIVDYSICQLYNPTMRICTVCRKGKEEIWTGGCVAAC